MSDGEHRRRRRRTRSEARDLQPGRRWGVSEVFSLAGLGVASTTVAVSAWQYGGIDAWGHLILQVGSLVASVFCLIGGLGSAGVRRRLPWVMLPLVLLCVQVLVQLLPIWRSPALSMSHAVFADFSGELPATVGVGREVLGPLTQAPGRTWLGLNQLISTVLLGFVFFETTSSVQRAVWACVPLILSGSAMGVWGLGDVLEEDRLGFGRFVNPNNAAGWLLVCLSAALFCAGVTFSKAPPLIRPALGQMTRRERFHYAIAHFARRVGELTPLQTAICVSCVLLLCAIVGTLSRAGIAVGVASVLVFFASRIRTNRWLMGVVGLSLLLVLSLGLLLLLDLDTPVLSELQTLKDPVSATTIRLLHWSDTVRSVLDFPLLGSGYSAYRYSALPYARRFTNNWFEWADNYFLELLVECGLCGFLLGALPGLLSLVYSLRMVFAGESLRAGVRRSCGDWCGSAILCLLVSLGAQNFFDFSIALGAVSAGAAMLLCIFERRYLDALSPSERERLSGAVAESTGVLARLSRNAVLSWSVWGVLLLGSCCLLRDCWNASVSQNSMLELRDLVLKPTPLRLIENGDRLLAAADAALAVRPYDESIARDRVLLMKRLAEREMYLEASGGRELDVAAQRQLFAAVEFHALALRYLVEESREYRREYSAAAERALAKYPWTSAGRELVSRWPLANGIAPELLIAGIFEGPMAESERDQLVYQTLFSDPHSADRLTGLGEYFVRAGETEKGLSMWAQSLAVSERFRGGILLAASAVFGVGQALEMFGPETFESAVSAARWLPAGELRTEVLGDGSRLWELGGFRLTIPVSIARADHLRMLGRTSEATEFLLEQMLTQPGELELMVRYAEALEEEGRNSDAYDAWLMVREADPDMPEIEATLARLARLPPVTVPEDAKVRKLMESKAKAAEEEAERKAKEERALKRGQAAGQKRPER
ncbi:MAG: hypothetical protein RLZZ458_1183 [Planctomycetota bacterium]